MSDIKDHRDLDAWRVAMDAVLETYKVSADFPPKETYGLTAQIRRAAVSVPSNIAEGQARTFRAAINHLGIALGSIAELDTAREAPHPGGLSRCARRFVAAGLPAAWISVDVGTLG